MKPTDTTCETRFREMPRDSKRPLLAVCAGVEGSFALSDADCLIDSVRELCTDAVNNEGMSADVAWLCSYALEIAQALRESVGTVA